jgi:hypothetical protein
MVRLSTMKKHKLTGQGGKGSARRNSNEKAYADNWDIIFGKKKKENKNGTNNKK